MIVDLGQTALSFRSLPSSAVGADAGLAITSGGCISSLSGVLIGDIWDGLYANTFTNVNVVGQSLGSGPLLVGVQTSDGLTSGSFTDPTSGLAQLPTPFVSGGFLIIGSGAATDAFRGTFGSGNSGNVIQSGFSCTAAFQRPHRYARLFVGSGFYDGPMIGQFIGNLKTTGSGGGYTTSPTSGGINV